MKVHVPALLALLVVGGVAFPVCARDYKTSIPGWTQMSKEDQDKLIKEITRKNHLKPGRDKIIIEDNRIVPNDKTYSYYSERGNSFICWFICCW